MKKKFGCLKYFIIIILTLLLNIYAIAKILPKAFNVAKSEIVENVFGTKVSDGEMETPKQETVVKKDSLITFTQPKNDSIRANVITVPVEISDKSTYLIVKVNGIDMKFMIDTGCSDMQITSAEYFHMKHLGIVSDSDIVENAKCVYADNSSNECPVIRIKNINIGGIEVKDINCTIQENAESSLLLGQQVLKQLGEISIDYNNKQLKIKR